MNRIPRWLAILLVVGLLAALGGGAAFYFITKQPESFVTQKIIKPVVGFMSGFKKFENVDESKPDFTLSSVELQSAFATDEAQAKEMYQSKIVQVNGMISSITAASDTNLVLLLEVDGISNISCQMDPQFHSRMGGVAPGNNVVIKGICSGSKKDDLLGSQDVLMNRCVLVN